MKELPDSKIYELELKYWPYRDSWQKVLEIIYEKAPKDGTLLDIMCGPGYLLGQISTKRSDLELTGMDIDNRYIDYSKKTYPQIQFQLSDVLSWEPTDKFDVVTCTGSIHHIPYDLQPKVVESISKMVKPDGFALLSDCFVDDYADEKQRKLAAAKLGYEYLKGTIENGAPDEAIKPCIDIIWNDVLAEEFKTTIKKRVPMYEQVFESIETIKTWPKFDSEYGDYIHICKEPKIKS